MDSDQFPIPSLRRSGWVMDELNDFKNGRTKIMDIFSAYNKGKAIYSGTDRSFTESVAKTFLFDRKQSKKMDDLVVTIWNVSTSALVGVVVDDANGIVVHDFANEMISCRQVCKNTLNF